MTVALASGPEFDRIRAIAGVLGTTASGLGDDCALVEFGGEFLALSTDLSIENVHFRREWLSLREIGWRAAAGALSDLAAVGAETIGVLASLAAPADSSPEDTSAIMDGIGAAAAEAGGKVLGGDLSSGPVWTIDVTVIGRVPVPVRRAGARPGDTVWVTGRLGGARAALEAFRAGQKPASQVREAFVHPVPRIPAGRWLAGHGARAMIDLSDGLAGDARHLAAASRVSLHVELERLPLAAGVGETAARLGDDPHLFAARGGEDYELLVVLPSGFGGEQTALFERDIGIPLTLIGAARDGEGTRLTLAGRDVSLTGFDHFA